jgi:hypothetical protein
MGSRQPRPAEPAKLGEASPRTAVCARPATLPQTGCVVTPERHHASGGPAASTQDDGPQDLVNTRLSCLARGGGPRRSRSASGASEAGAPSWCGAAWDLVHARVMQLMGASGPWQRSAVGMRRVVRIRRTGLPPRVLSIYKLGGVESMEFAHPLSRNTPEQKMDCRACGVIPSVRRCTQE